MVLGLIVIIEDRCHVAPVRTRPADCCRPVADQLWIGVCLPPSQAETVSDDRIVTAARINCRLPAAPTAVTQVMLCMTGCGMTTPPAQRRLRHAQRDRLRLERRTFWP